MNEDQPWLSGWGDRPANLVLIPWDNLNHWLLVWISTPWARSYTVVQHFCLQLIIMWLLNFSSSQSMCVYVIQNGLVRCDKAADSSIAEPVSSRVSVSATDEVMSQSADAVESHVTESVSSQVSVSATDIDATLDVESCVTASTVACTVNKQLSSDDSSLSSCCCKMSSCTY